MTTKIIIIFNTLYNIKKPTHKEKQLYNFVIVVVGFLRFKILFWKKKKKF